MIKGIVTALTIMPKTLDTIPLTAFAETRSVLIEVSEFTMHVTAPLATEYAVQHTIYVTAHQIAFALFGISRFKKVRQLNRASTGAPYNIYGRYLPNLLLVFSAIPPNTGSQIACQIRAINMIIDITAGASPTTSE